MWNGNQWIIRSPALFNTIATNEIFWLYYLEQLVILPSSNLYTYRHNFSNSATLFQLYTIIGDTQWQMTIMNLQEGKPCNMGCPLAVMNLLQKRFDNAYKPNRTMRQETKNTR